MAASSSPGPRRRVSLETLIAGLVGGAVASAGLWWFRLMMPVVRRQEKPIRWSVYAAIWLAYFILTIILINRSGA